MPDLYDRVRAIREYVAENGRPTDWTPEQWLAGAIIQLGQAAVSLHSANETPSPAEGVEHLLAAAAVCLDAVEAIER